ncbi:hypothetical protein AB1Y20_000556 [Prymnesium parvum]|uniref:DUF4209 domain-containing protein n=1 Tax=Prymnesium parvum TaxID=97485 RepID=A0AB34KAR0_PRYPA
MAEVLLEAVVLPGRPHRVCARVGMTMLSEDVREVLSHTTRTDPLPADLERHAMDAVCHSAAGSTPLAALHRASQLADAWLGSIDAHAFNRVAHRATSALTHGFILASLFDRLAAGKAYEAFLLGVPVLERAIGELAARGAARASAHRSHLAKAAPLLKDLVASAELASELGAPAAALLQTFFSPTLVNARNLAWHGFSTAVEWPRRFSSLLVLLLVHAGTCLADETSPPPLLVPAAACLADETSPPPLLVPAAACLADVPPPPPHLSAAPRGRALWPHDADGALLAALQPLLRAAPSPTHADWPALCAACVSSRFVRPGQMAAVEAALRSYAAGDVGSFACLALPSLEAGLRGMFVEANPEELPLGFAHLGRYFSTLNGYGQRAKHQLLLEPTLLSTGRRNRLVDVLGRGTHDLLLDLFLHDAGPSLRAKFAHGEAALCLRPLPPPHAPPAVFVAVLCVLFHLCALPSVARLREAIGAYRSACDPHARLHAAARAVRSRLGAALSREASYALLLPLAHEGLVTVHAPAGAAAERAVGVAAVLASVDALLARIDALSQARAASQRGGTCPPEASSDLAAKFATLHGCERALDLEGARLDDLCGRVRARAASTAQRRMFAIASHASVCLRRMKIMQSFLVYSSSTTARGRSAGARTAPPASRAAPAATVAACVQRHEAQRHPAAWAGPAHAAHAQPAACAQPAHAQPDGWNLSSQLGHRQPVEAKRKAERAEAGRAACTARGEEATEAPRGKRNACGARRGVRGVLTRAGGEVGRGEGKDGAGGL